MIISIVSGYYCFHDSGLITGESVRNQLFTPRLFVRVGSKMIDYFAIQVNTAPSFGICYRSQKLYWYRDCVQIICPTSAFIPTIKMKYSSLPDDSSSQ